MKPVTFPLDQYYDGNQVGTNPAKGHLFERDSNKALCGLNKSSLDAPILEDTFDNIMEIPTLKVVKRCEKCRTIAITKKQP